MDPVTRAALTSWNWRPDVIFILGAVAYLYVNGWLRLRRRTGNRQGPWDRLSAVWRPIAYCSGLFVLALALLSPIDVLVQQLFFVHMIQHLLLIMLAPPLLLIANPMPFLLWGLPEKWRLGIGHWLGRLLNKDSASGRFIRKVTAPGIILLVYVIVVIGWHDTTLYNFALRSGLIHDIEHITFFAAGMLFWWHVTGAGPRLHKQFGGLVRIAYVLAAIPPNMALGVVLAFSGVVIYTYYLDVPRLWNISALNDQRISGIIMWIPGSMMYLITALILIAGLLGREEVKPSPSDPAWHDDEQLRAPGVSSTGNK